MFLRSARGDTLVDRMVSRHSIVSVQDMCMDLDKFTKKMFAVILSFCKLEV